MLFIEKNKYGRVLIGHFLFISYFSASTALATEQIYHAKTYDSQSESYSHLKESLQKELQLETGYSYTHWIPDKISGAKIETKGLNLGWVELQSNTLSILRELNLSIPKLRYEFSDVEDNSDDEVIYSEYEKTEYYHYFNGIISIIAPHYQVPIAFRYETERFVSKLTSQDDLYYVPDSGDSYKKFQRGDTLYHETIFHDYSLLSKFKRGSYNLLEDADIFFGIFYFEYQKPYNIDEELNDRLYYDIRDDYIFYSKFKGKGLLLERITQFDVEGPRIDFSLKIGFGDVELINDYKLSDLVRPYSSISHDYENIIYINPKVIFGYKIFFDFSKNIFLDAFISADYRYFDINNSDDDCNINSDLLLKAYVSIGITF